MAFSLLRQGRLIPVPTVEQAERWAASRPKRQSSRRFVVGSPATVRAGKDGLTSMTSGTRTMLATGAKSRKKS